MSEEWYYAKHGILFGPVTLPQLSELVDKGTVRPVDLVWNKQMIQWAAAGSVQGLFANVFTPPLPPPLPLPPPEPLPPPLPPTVQPLELDSSHRAAGEFASAPSYDAHRGRGLGRRSKWMFLGWSAACLSGLAYGFVRESPLPMVAQFASGQGSLLQEGGLEVATWCIIWAAIGLPALTVWLLSKK